MLGIERRRKIMDQLTQDRKVYVADLSKLFNVTEETVRRDLEKLENPAVGLNAHSGVVVIRITASASSP